MVAIGNLLTSVATVGLIERHSVVSYIDDVGRLWMFIATGAVILLLALLVGLAYPKTTYAPGYSGAKFRQIRNGMTKDEVRRTLGEPLYANGGGVRWYWAYSADHHGEGLDVGYYSRGVYFSNDVVVGKLKHFVLFQ